MPIASVDPATGETVATFSPLSDAALEQRLALAARTFSGWRRERPAARAQLLRKTADLFTARREALARLATLEMSKLYTAALGEMDKCAGCLRWYADKHERLLAPKEM